MQDIRVAYLSSKEGVLSQLCCFLPCSRDIQLEIALFKRSYKPNESIQALVNLGQHQQRISRVTMSLYLMLEIKDPCEVGFTLSKYTTCHRIYETVYQPQGRR